MTDTRDQPHEDAPAAEQDGEAWSDSRRMDGRGRLLLALAATLFVLLRLWRLTDSCLWFDEIFSVHAARHPWSDLPAFVAADIIHPPLFYALLKIWMALGGESLFWLRLFPALTAIATILPLLLLARSLRIGATATTLALALAAVSGYLIKYAQELRMYSLLLFFTTWSLWLFVRYTDAPESERPKRLLLPALSVVNLALVYTHYYGWLLVATQMAFLMLSGQRARLARFALATAALALCFAPWAYLVARTAASSVVGRGLVQNIGWMQRPTLVTVAEFYATLNELLYYRQSSDEPLFTRLGAPLVALVFGSLALLWLARAIRRARRGSEAVPPTAQRTSADVAWWLVLFSLLPVALAFIASHLLPYSVWGSRHLIMVAAPHTLLVAVAISRLRPAWLRAAPVLLVVCLTLFNAALLLSLRRGEGEYVWCAWDPLVQSAVETEGLGAERIKVYAFEDLVAYHAWFSLSGMKHGRFAVEVVSGVPGIEEDPAYFLPRGFDEVEKREAAQAFAEDGFWVAFRDTDSSWNPQRQPAKLLAERGYEVETILQMRARRGGTAYVVRLRRRGQPPPPEARPPS